MISATISTAQPPTLAYVIGTTDCGSTLLAFVLDTHPSICALGEPPKRAIRRRGDAFVCSCGETIARCPFWQILFGSLSAHGCHFTHTNWPNDYHYLTDFANSVLAKYQHNPMRRGAQMLLSSVLPSHRRKVATASRCSVEFVRSALAQTGKSVFLETSKDLFRFEQLRRLNGWNLKVIRMTRDVRWFAYTKAQRLDSGAAARQWLAYHLAANRVLEDLPDESQTVVRYEDLCNHPVAEARRLQRFLAVAEYDPPAEFDPGKHHILGDGISGRFTISTEARWRAGLSTDDQARALDIAGDQNRLLGYED